MFNNNIFYNSVIVSITYWSNPIILSTLINDFMARAIYIGQTNMKIDKEFSYLPSKRPVYYEQALVESEEEMSDSKHL